ncbi:MAG TPA: hypothetical protein VFL85_04480 [Candidatus Saccharimonadales bacterium]|nr:hypothetical protein [Candidatus Saccharimonadales bacterium]
MSIAIPHFRAPGHHPEQTIPQEPTVEQQALAEAWLPALAATLTENPAADDMQIGPFILHSYAEGCLTATRTSREATPEGTALVTALRVVLKRMYPESEVWSSAQKSGRRAVREDAARMDIRLRPLAVRQIDRPKHETLEAVGKIAKDAVHRFVFGFDPSVDEEPQK